MNHMNPGLLTIAQDRQWGSNRPDVRWMMSWLRKTDQVFIILEKQDEATTIWQVLSNWEAT